MVFLSAQPDEYYFLWQLQLQIYNFTTLGISKDQIHILIGYDPDIGLSEDYKHLIAIEKHACFYTYPDTRTDRSYPPSIRPHIISKHITTFPEVGKGEIFYHDSDILFKELPNISPLQQGETWYASDTRSYLDSNYIKGKGGSELFSNMCNSVGISEAVVISNDHNASGAQYIIKNAPTTFWEKV
jgi:hypothetical protein